MTLARRTFLRAGWPFVRAWNLIWRRINFVRFADIVFVRDGAKSLACCEIRAIASGGDEGRGPVTTRRARRVLAAWPCRFDVPCSEEMRRSCRDIACGKG